MQKLPFTKDFNKLFIAYCSMLLLAIIAAVLTAVAEGLAFNGRIMLDIVFLRDMANRPTLVFLGVFSLVPWLISIVFFCMMLYRLWELVPRQSRRYEPGHMVAFIFIPLFNLYWIFVAVLGCGKAYNKLFDYTKLNLGIWALIYCIAQCFAWVGPIRDFAWMVAELLCAIWLYQMKNAAIILQQRVLNGKPEYLGEQQ